MRSARLYLKYVQVQPMQIKRLPTSYHQQVLGYSDTPVSKLDQSRIRNIMTPFNLQDAQDPSKTVLIPIPESFGTWKEEAAKAVLEHTQGTLDNLAAAATWTLPELPSNYNYVTGWQIWDKKKERWVRLDGPSKIVAKTFILDFETVNVSPQDQPEQWLPTCAVGLSDKTWVLWVTDFDSMITSVPIGTSNTIVGFNTGYDRSYLAPEYQLEDTGNRFFDLMSAWIVCRGLSNQQRPLFLGKSGDDYEPDWFDETSTNSLSSVYQFYFGNPLDKGVRDDIMVKGLPWVRDNMKAVIEYCAMDVLSTAQLYQRLYPEYLLHRPSKVTQSGAILLGSTWLPLDNTRYYKYYNEAEKIYQETKKKSNNLLMSECARFLDEVLELYPFPLALLDRKITPEDQEDLYKSWVSQMPLAYQSLDWYPAKSGKCKGVPKWFRVVMKDFREQQLTISKRFVPIVLGITWRGSALIWDESEAYWYTEEVGAIPHPENRGSRVSCIFVKGFVKAFEDGLLSAPESVRGLIADKMASINWVSLRKRVGALHTESPQGYPVVLPQIAVNGTVTGRCTDSLWQVASNPKRKRVGTELKSMVSPPPGYTFIGADIDSQEAWLAAILGDALMGICGSTPFGLMCLVGQKEDKTDVHSVVSILLGILRDIAKICVYGSLYGQGKKGATDTLVKNLLDKSVDECALLAYEFIAKMKGQVQQGTGYLGRYKKYVGGLASESFNKMEAIADSKAPRTPLFGNLLSKSLAGIKDFKPSRVNWVVQSSGVDMRDLLVLLTRHFFKQLGVEGRIMITIHDEIRTIVKDDSVTKAVHALQLAHLYSRAAFIDCLGLDCIPSGIAWFSAVDIDKYCLRKDPSDPQITPSQPEGIPKGYTVDPGQLLDLLK
jgi:DNA polymerase gamma 1